MTWALGMEICYCKVWVDAKSTPANPRDYNSRTFKISPIEGR